MANSPSSSPAKHRLTDYNTVQKTLRYMQYGSVGIILISAVILLDQGTTSEARARATALPSVEINLDVLEPYYRQTDHFEENKPRLPHPLMEAPKGAHALKKAESPATVPSAAPPKPARDALKANVKTPPRPSATAPVASDNTDIIAAVPTTKAAPAATSPEAPKAPPPLPPLPEKAAPPPLPELPSLPEKDPVPALPPLPGSDTEPPPLPTLDADMGADDDAAELPPLPDVSAPIDNDAPDLPPLPGESEPFSMDADADMLSIPPLETEGDSTAKTAPRLLIEYTSGETELPISAEKDLDIIAEVMMSDIDVTLNILSFAGAPADQSGSARRVALDRALAIRTYLMDQNIDIFRIQVDAQNAAQSDNNPDRVELYY